MKNKEVPSDATMNEDGTVDIGPSASEILARRTTKARRGIRQRMNVSANPNETFSPAIRKQIIMRQKRRWKGITG